jgi:nitrate/TMAO reductase-like tetraheme cytochrome c subunit
MPCDAEEIDAASKAVTLATASGCMFRVEFQTLSRLPDTQSLLFTIHTHQQPLRELSRSQKQRLASVISTCPESTLRYKGIWPMKKSVCEYLQTT